MTTKRFRIAFSFAGEKREFVAQVAASLAAKFGEDFVIDLSLYTIRMPLLTDG